MSTITPHYRSVSQLLQNQSFSIDEYQREYKWEKENIQELLSDLLEKFRGSYQPGHETSKVAGYADYFLGSIIVSRREGKSFLVDGPKRGTFAGRVDGCQPGRARTIEPCRREPTTANTR